MAKIDVERVITEYFMLKTVLNNKYAMDVISGRIEPAGPSAAADKRTLQAMQRYVRKLDDLVIAGNGLTGGETLSNYLTRVTKNFKEMESRKPESRRLEYSENPFDDNFKYYVSAVLNSENAKGKIEKAILSDKTTLDSVNSLVVNLGGKKQSSYVKLLSQSTELFSTVSGLRSEIDTLRRSRNADKNRIKNLEEKLAEKAREAENYRSLCEKAIEELGNASGATILVAMLKETSNSLDGVIREEGRKTREHITSETDRIIDSTQTKDKIKSHILSNHKQFPRYIACYQGTELSGKGLKGLHEEIMYAAKQVGISEEDPAVSSLYNDLCEQNLKNTMVSDRPEKKSGKKVVPVVTGILIASLFASGAFLAASNYHLHNDLHAANEQIAQMTQDQENSDVFQNEYLEYMEREQNQLNDFTSKLQIAVDGGTYVVINENGEVVPGDVSVNGWNKTTLDELINKYTADDNEADYGWASTSNMQAAAENAELQAKATYYQQNYEQLLVKVESLNQEIAQLNQKLADAQKMISSSQMYIGDLTLQINQLQSQIDNLQSIIDAGGGNSSELQAKVDELQTALDAANNKIDELEAQNEALQEENQELKEENQQLKNEINELQNQVNTLNSTIETLQNKNTVLSTEKASLQIQVSELQTTVSELQAKVDSLLGTDAGQEILKLEEQINYLEGVIEEANAKIESLQATNEELSQTIVNLESNISTLESDVEALETAIESLTNENTSLKTQVSNLQNSLSESMNNYNELLDKYNDLVENGAISPEEMAAVQAELNSAYNLITSYENQIVELYNGITNESTNTSQAQQDLESLLKMFGIDYNEKDTPSNDNSEYQPH